MAKRNEEVTGHIYDLHARWIREVLDGEGSLLDGSSVWTEESIEEVVERFIENPDLTPGKSFRDKLRDQMDGASPAAIQLIAEILIIHFLHVSKGAISPKTKLAQIEMVLSWMARPPEVPDDVIKALGPGLIHPGQYALTRRDVQLTWIINFSRAWLPLSTERRELLLSDPWEFRDFTSTVGKDTGVNAEVATHHMTHPEAFESIVATRHKRAIVRRFGALIDDGTDLDRELIEVRAAVEAERASPVDWYTDPDLPLMWLKNEKLWSTFLEWSGEFRSLEIFDDEERDFKLALARKLASGLEACVAGSDEWVSVLKSALRDPLNNLTSWRSVSKFIEWMDREPEKARASLLVLWADDGDVESRLSDFFADVPDEVLSTTGERLDLGSVLLMAVDAEKFPPFKISVLRKAWKLLGWPSDTEDELSIGALYGRALLVLDEILFESEAAGRPMRDRLDAQSAMWSVVHWPKKPDAFEDSRWGELLAYRKAAGVAEEPAEPVDTESGDDSDEDLEIVDYIGLAADELCVERDVLDDIVDLLEDKGQTILYGPPGTGKTYLALRLARAIAEGHEERVGLVQFHPATTYEDFIEGLRPTISDAGQVGYQLVPGPLVRIAEQARANPDQKFVLVVDEINRANLPKVFGELLLLLEHRSERAQLIHRPGEPFSLPLNLWIIGTMNTADRSIALIDAAMRRRFHFVGFFPHVGPMRGLLRAWLDRSGGRASIADFLNAVNEELVSTVGDHLLVGPSHFMRADLSDRALERIWEHNVFPLLEELFWGDREAIDTWRWEAVRSRHAAVLAGSAGPVNADLLDAGSDPNVGGQGTLEAETVDSSTIAE